MQYKILHVYMCTCVLSTYTVLCMCMCMCMDMYMYTMCTCMLYTGCVHRECILRKAHTLNMYTHVSFTCTVYMYMFKHMYMYIDVYYTCSTCTTTRYLYAHYSGEQIVNCKLQFDCQADALIKD